MGRVVLAYLLIIFYLLRFVLVLFYTFFFFFFLKPFRKSIFTRSCSSDEIKKHSDLFDNNNISPRFDFWTRSIAIGVTVFFIPYVIILCFFFYFIYIISMKTLSFYLSIKHRKITYETNNRLPFL